MMLTQKGKLLYISDNAAEYLGHSMVSYSFDAGEPTSAQASTCASQPGQVSHRAEPRPRID